MLTYRPQSGRLGRAVRAASLGLLVTLSFGGCSGCNCFDLGNLNCGISDTTCFLFCASGGGGASSTFVGGASPGSGGSGGHPLPIGLGVALDLPAQFTPFDVVRSVATNGYFFTATGPAGVGVYGCSGTSCGRVDNNASWGFPTWVDALDDATLWIVDAAPGPLDDTPRLYLLPVGFAPEPIDLGRFTPRAVARGVGKAKTRFYMSGIDPTGLPAVGFVQGAAGPPSVVYAGSPLVDPAALAVDSKGVIYVVENRGPGERPAVFRVDQGVATPVLTGLDVGYPSGIAFDPSNQKLLVLVRDGVSGATRLLRANTDGSDPELLGDTVFGAAAEPGGLHGPADDGTFAMVDSSAHRIFTFR